MNRSEKPEIMVAAPNLRLYSDLSSWWPLMSPPSEYIEEAADLLQLLLGDSDLVPPRTLLELGSGGGSLAHNLKDHFKGAIYEARFTRRGLTPSEFLKMPPSH